MPPFPCVTQQHDRSTNQSQDATTGVTGLTTPFPACRQVQFNAPRAAGVHEQSQLGEQREPLRTLHARNQPSIAELLAGRCQCTRPCPQEEKLRKSAISRCLGCTT